MDFVEGLVNELTERQKAMKENFLEGKKEFTENLYHGLLTTLSIILGEWCNFITMVQIDRERTQKLYSRAMDEIMKVLSPQFRPLPLPRQSYRRATRHSFWTTKIPRKPSRRKRKSTTN